MLCVALGAAAQQAKFAGSFYVDGYLYPTLTAAWNAAVSAANATGTNQVVQLGVGNYNVSSTLTEPTNGACVSVLGTSAPTQTANNAVPATTINVNASVGGDLFFLGNTNQAQGCTFRDLNILGNKYITHAFELQYFRGLSIDDVMVNDTTDTGILLGEASGSHRSFFDMRNVTVSYSASSFTPASRPNYGIQLQPTAIDSNIDTLYVRNAQSAAIYNQGTGIHTMRLHGFGFPYTCTTPPCNNHESNSGASDASYASDYVVIDTGGSGNTYLDSYLDSPALAAFDLSANGVVITSGYLEWPDDTSFPNANLAWIQNTFTSNLVINNIGCINMNTSQAGAPSSPAGASGVWISYFLTDGTAPTLSSVSNLSGCGDYYQQRFNARQTAFDVQGNNASALQAVTPKIFVTPLDTSAVEGGIEVQNFSGGKGDVFFSGFTAQYSNFAVRASGSVKMQGLETNVVSVTASTALTEDNQSVMANAASGAIMLTLPQCGLVMVDGLPNTGQELTIYRTNTSGSNVTIQTSSSQQIFQNGTNIAPYTMSAAGSIALTCGTDNNWYAR